MKELCCPVHVEHDGQNLLIDGGRGRRYDSVIIKVEICPLCNRPVISERKGFATAGASTLRCVDAESDELGVYLRGCHIGRIGYERPTVICGELDTRDLNSIRRVVDDLCVFCGIHFAPFGEGEGQRRRHSHRKASHEEGAVIAGTIIVGICVSAIAGRAVTTFTADGAGVLLLGICRPLAINEAVCCALRSAVTATAGLASCMGRIVGGTPLAVGQAVCSSFGTAVATGTAFGSAMLRGRDALPTAVGKRMVYILISAVAAGTGNGSAMLGVRIACPGTVAKRVACVFVGAVAASGTGLGATMLGGGVVRPGAVAEAVVRISRRTDVRRTGRTV